MRKIDPVLHDRLAVLIESMKYELVGCEMISQGYLVFRIYIDSPNGITVDDCSRVSHQVSAMMDVEEPIQGRYVLEVSSPGIDRPLFELAQYEKYIGRRVKIRLYSPINQRRHYTGTLERVEGEDVYLVIEGQEQAMVLPFSIIEKANLTGDVHL